MRRPSKLTSPLAGGTSPMIAFMRRRLAGAVAAEQRHDLAGRRLQRHAVQDVGAAVIGVQVPDREHQCALPR